MRFSLVSLVCLALGGFLFVDLASAQQRVFAVSGQGRGGQADARQSAQISQLESENVDRKAETTQNASDISDNEARITNNENELATIQPHARQAQQVCGAGQLIQWNASSYSCVSEDDPTVGPHALTTTVPPDCHDTNAKLLWNGATQQWHCEQDMNDGSGGTFTETDPEVGTLLGGRLCRSGGSQVHCDSGAPSVLSGGGINVSGNVLVGGTVSGNDATFTGPVAGATPTASNHLATKDYVDAIVGGGGGGDDLGNHTATTTLDMAGNPIAGVADPTAAQEAATKAYVDAAVSGGGGGSGDDLGNHTATQALNMGGNPITAVGAPSANTDAATKGYVDAAVSGVSGGGGGGDDLGNHTATTTLAMAGNPIDGVADPTTAQQAATKAYVDAAVSGGGGSGDNLGDHTATQDLSMGGHAITGLADPTGPMQATTKQYVDAAVGGVGGDNLGDHSATQDISMNGNVIFGLGDPTGPQQAATKSYVDGAIPSCSWTGSMQMGGCGGQCGFNVSVPVGNCSGGVFTGFSTTTINCGTCK